MQIDIAALERGLTAYLAGKLQLTVDAGIYRGQIPVNKSTGVAVRISSQQPAGFYDCPEYDLQIYVKDTTREGVWQQLSKLAANTPFFGVDVAGYNIVSALPYTGGDPYAIGDNGRQCWAGSTTLRCSVRVANIDL